MKQGTGFAVKATLYAGALLSVIAMAIVGFPYLKAAYYKLASNFALVFTDETATAGLNRHHSGPDWQGTFSTSVVDFDNDGDDDLFVNNHERNRPYFYKNAGDGTFTEGYEQAGILENDLGSVFGAPTFDRHTAGIFIWLDPGNAITGNWHIRWFSRGHAPLVITGSITTNSEVEAIKRVNLAQDSQLTRKPSSVEMNSTADGEIRGFDFKSSYPESTLTFDIRLNDAKDVRRIFIGPAAMNPVASPFDLSLGDRHATAWGDFNNDGTEDLFVTRGAMVGALKPPHAPKHEELFANDGSQGFTNVLRTSKIINDYGRGRSAQWVDYDNDGKLDLYITNLEKNNLLYHNQGGSFEDKGRDTGLDFDNRMHCLWADFNGDGFADAFFQRPVGLFINQRDGTFREDMAVRQLALANNAKPSGEDPFWGGGISAADYDNDGDLDVLLAGGPIPYALRLLENDAATFTDVTAKVNFGALKEVLEGIWGDYDNDGHVDLYVISSDPASNRLLRNTGRKTFEDETKRRNLSLSGRPEWIIDPRAGWSATWLDYNHDGWLDLFMATRRPKGSSGRTDEFAGRLPQGVAGLPARIANRFKPVMKGKIPGTHVLFHNRGRGHHWLRIKLVGTQSNRSGFGAKIRVTTDSHTQFKEVGAVGKMRYAQNSAPVHFGLGGATRVNRIEILWPSGLRQVLNNVGIDQLTIIEEKSND